MSHDDIMTHGVAMHTHIYIYIPTLDFLQVVGNKYSRDQDLVVVFHGGR